MWVVAERLGRVFGSDVSGLLGLFALALVGAQIRISSVPELGARLELEIYPLMPARIYLFKDNQPFRLSPVDVLLPLRLTAPVRGSPRRRRHRPGAASARRRG